MSRCGGFRVKIPERLAVALAVWLASAQLAAAEPKYGPEAVRLHDDRAYLQRSAAPDFWALMPYYLPQQTESSCSVASVAMLLNALRAELPLAADDPLVTETGLMKRAANAAWKKAAAQGGAGVSLDQLGRLIERSLTAYGLGAHEVEVVHVESTSDAMLARLREVLAETETSAGDFIVINFIQSVFTGDPDGNVGHIAPLAAYDAERQRALIFDPDRRWYEPYWVSDRTLLAGMATRDDQAPGKGAQRGYVRVRKAAAK
jgi:hypothetical protein